MENYLMIYKKGDEVSSLIIRERYPKEAIFCAYKKISKSPYINLRDALKNLMGRSVVKKFEEICECKVILFSVIPQTIFYCEDYKSTAPT